MDEMSRTVGELHGRLGTLEKSVREIAVLVREVRDSQQIQFGERKAARRLSALTATVVSLSISLAGLLFSAWRNAKGVHP